MTMAERKSNIRLTKDTPYLALMGELWGVFCEDFEKIDRVITGNATDSWNPSSCKTRTSLSCIIFNTTAADD